MDKKPGQMARRALTDGRFWYSEARIFNLGYPNQAPGISRCPNLPRSVILASLISATAQANTPVPTPNANPVVVPAAPEISAKAHILIDYYSGQVLAEQNAEERLPPASLTKMMTSYIIGQELLKGNIKRTDMVTISQNAWSKNYSDSSKMFIEVGKQVSVDDLNKGIIIQSGNDACVAMAEFLAGSTDSFASLMNSWAAKLGMNDSHFMNPQDWMRKVTTVPPTTWRAWARP